MLSPPNILVVCGRNKRRSRTAEYIFKTDKRFHIRSVGISPSSDRRLSEKDLVWADLVFVMDTDQRSRIRDLYKQTPLPKIEILDIPDEYEFMDEELIGLLKDRINDSLRLLFNV